MWNERNDFRTVSLPLFARQPNRSPAGVQHRGLPADKLVPEVSQNAGSMQRHLNGRARPVDRKVPNMDCLPAGSVRAGRPSSCGIQLAVQGIEPGLEAPERAFFLLQLGSERRLAIPEALQALCL